ncbi:MAG TPA: inorganic phosphate transporter, partial [Candidatus Bathyarchaeia archaeon]|nr:inorganic phosphate transporter [Candidatus Bathyarchaeia archaeon]
WGGFFTGVGSFTAILISTRLFNVFTPQNLITAPQPQFVLAALGGATLWILAATLARLPVSSTHAIVGALVILAVKLYGTSAVQWTILAFRVVLPLAGGPVAALVGIYVIDRLTRRTGAPGKSRPRLTQIAHWMTGAATAFARGMNDAPKMAALGAFFLLANPSESQWVPYSIIAVAVLLGSIVLGHRVVVTAIGKHASLDQVQRSKANAATALVVSAGAILGAPVSTTQVHQGSSAGIGRDKSVIRSSLRSMLLPWFVTLPGAGIFAIVVSYIGMLL